MSKDKNLMSEATSKQKFTDYTLHVEFRLSYMPEARGQARSNSGIYLHDCYEIQVLDSFGLEGEDNECGGIYQFRKPDVNMCYPPLTWQTYDVDFTAPRYKDGKKTANAGRSPPQRRGDSSGIRVAARHARPRRKAPPRGRSICKGTATRLSSAISGSLKRSRKGRFRPCLPNYPC